MHPSAYPSAWEHPPTRRAWARQTTISILAFPGWILVPGGLLFLLIDSLPSALVAVFAISVIYGAYRACVQPLLIFLNFRTRRILRAYPWHLGDTPFSRSPHPESPNTKPWLAFPNPARPEEAIPMHFHLHYHTVWWERRMSERAKAERKAQLAPIWFAGDPRFFGVIAVTGSGGDGTSPAPKRLHFLAQISPEKKGAAIDDNPWQASPEDYSRARQAVGKGALHD